MTIPAWRSPWNGDGAGAVARRCLRGLVPEREATGAEPEPGAGEPGVAEEPATGERGRQPTSERNLGERLGQRVDLLGELLVSASR